MIATNNGGHTGPYSGPWGCNAYMGGSEYSDADVAEILAFNNVISNQNRTALDNYLQNKYGLGGHIYRWIQVLSIPALAVSKL